MGVKSVIIQFYVHIQVCANSLDPDHFIRTVLERFHVLDLLTFIQQDSPKKLGFLEADKQMPMLEGVLMFLSMLLGVRTQLGTCIIFKSVLSALYFYLHVVHDREMCY